MVGDDDCQRAKADRDQPLAAAAVRRRLAFGERHQHQRKQRQRNRLVGELGAPEEEVAGPGVDGDREAGDPRRPGDPGKEEEERDDEEQARGSDDDDPGTEARHAGERHQRRGRALQAGVARGHRQYRIAAEQMVVVDDLLRVVGVHELVGEGEEQRVVDDLDSVQRQPEQADKGEPFARGCVHRGEPEEDRQDDQEQPRPVDQGGRRLSSTRESVGDRADQKTQPGTECN